MGRFKRQAASVRFHSAGAGLHRNRSQDLLPTPLGWAESHAPLRQSLGVQAQRLAVYSRCRAGGTGHHALDWLDNVPTLPVRLAKIGSHRAIDAQFQGVPFETFIVCDNLYQGYLATKQDNLLDELAAHLYDTSRIKLDEAERVSVFYWMASLKTYLASNFKHFFQPIDNASDANGNMFEQEQSQFEMLQNAVNAQIRALTKGDITKEQQVLSLNTWRALTELDAQAKEYEEFNAKYPSK